MISVIITCHNLERYIGAAIESVLAQDYVGEMDVLVIDDQSSDASASIIMRYPKVRYLRTETNVGVLNATVMGIEKTSGDLVFFLDGDDIWEPEKVSNVVAVFASNPACNLVTHDMFYIDSDDKPIDRLSRPSVAFKDLSRQQADQNTQHAILLHTDYVWLGSAYAVHRHKADLVGFCAFARALPDSFNTYQDWPLAYWAAAQPSSESAYISKKLFRYRLHGANHSGDSSSLAKAQRNFRRTLNTMQAIRQIAVRFAVDQTAQYATDRKLKLYQYYNDLYADRRMAAFSGFCKNLGYIVAGNASILKEITRFVGIFLLGAQGFTKARNALSIQFRNNTP